MAASNHAGPNLPPLQGWRAEACNCSSSSSSSSSAAASSSSSSSSAAASSSSWAGGRFGSCDKLGVRDRSETDHKAALQKVYKRPAGVPFFLLTCLWIAIP